MEKEHFSKGDSMKCTNLFTVDVGKYLVQRVSVPCNYCLSCRINRVTMWSFRILTEIPKYKKSMFVCLTYEDAHLPMAKGKDFVIPTLRKEEIVRFHKRLRWHGLEFKYYVCGEYGGEGDRPHYHGIYLGIGDKHDKAIFWQAWNRGHIDFGRVEGASIRYTCEYIMDKDKEETYEPAEPPFQLVSQNFGKDYIEEDIERIVASGFITDANGRKIRIPKFIYDLYREEFLAEKARRNKDPLQSIRSKLQSPMRRYQQYTNEEWFALDQDEKRRAQIAKGNEVKKERKKRKF